MQHTLRVVIAEIIFSPDTLESFYFFGQETSQKYGGKNHTFTGA